MEILCRSPNLIVGQGENNQVGVELSRRTSRDQIGSATQRSRGARAVARRAS
jgi:hypothetical protein